MPRLTDVTGILVGHATDSRVGTGCTVILAPEDGMRGAVFVRGRATGTRELDVLSPRHLAAKVNAILLTGGSAYGLGAADGVMRWLQERQRGFDVGVGVVPIVPSGVIFDLGFGEPTPPRPSDGYEACRVAGIDVLEGSVGAGTGATVGKVLGADGMMKGGVGTWSARRGEIVVGALAVVNAFGDVRDASGSIIVGARGPNGFIDACRYLANGGVPLGSFARDGVNTTLIVVATNADTSRLELLSVAEMAADALGRRVTPAGTQFDGDLVFAVSAGELLPSTKLEVEILAQEATATAIERAVRVANGTGEVPGLGDS